jgi:hypothetical protein
MNQINLFVQIVMIAIAVGVVIFYVNPTVANIKQTQDLNQKYLDEINKVVTVNSLLQENVNQISSISRENKKALLRYLPDSVDEIAVLKDLSNIAARSLISPTSLEFIGKVNNEDSSNYDNLNLPVKDVEEFKFSFVADVTYAQLKSFLADLESNTYLIQINSLNILPGDADMLNIEVELQTFSRSPNYPPSVNDSGAIITP